MKEEWKDVPGFEGSYSVSNYGRIKVLEHTIIRKDGKPYTSKEKILRPHITRGYKQAMLANAGERKYIGVHRLVAMAFVPNPDNKSVVNHIDGNKQNNHVDNLEWVTSSENAIHAFRTGLSHAVKGNCKLTEDQVRIIKQAYKNRKGRFWGKKQLAKKMQISQTTIDFIIREKTWSDVS